MQHRKETRPCRQANGRESKNAQSIAQKNTNRFGFWFGLMWVAAWGYVIFDWAGVIA